MNANNNKSLSSVHKYNNNITFLVVHKKWLYQLMFPILGKPKKYNLWLRKQSKYIKYNLLGRHLQEKG